jgi:hypothetical protein
MRRLWFSAKRFHRMKASDRVHPGRRGACPPDTAKLPNTRALGAFRDAHSLRMSRNEHLNATIRMNKSKPRPAGCRLVLAHLTALAASADEPSPLTISISRPLKAIDMTSKWRCNLTQSRAFPHTVRHCFCHIDQDFACGSARVGVAFSSPAQTPPPERTGSLVETVAMTGFWKRLTCKGGGRAFEQTPRETHV